MTVTWRFFPKKSVTFATMKRVLLFCSITLMCMSVSAQKTFRQRVDSTLTKLRRNTADTNYVVRPQGDWTLRVLASNSGARTRTKGNGRKEFFTTDVEAGAKSTLSLSANYRGLSASVALNPAKMFGNYRDFELNLNAYGNRFGIDYIYQSASTFTGQLEAPSGDITIESGMVEQRSLTVNSYFVFNHRRFSFPAAFSQSYLQRRSAGSLFIGASYHGGSLLINNPEPTGEDISRIRTNHAGIGLGYAYNFVPGKRWLIHLSAQPSWVLWSRNTIEYMDGDSDRFRSGNELLFVVRSAVIHYFARRYFAGLTFVYNYSQIGEEENLRVTSSKWRARMIVGVRL